MRNNYWATGRKSELILAELAFRRLARGSIAELLKKIGSVKLVVPEELPECSMQIVGAGLDRCIQNGSSRTTVFGTEVRCLDREFLDRVNRRQHHVVGAVEKVNRVRVVVDPVQEVIVLRRTESVCRERATRGIASRIGLWRIHSR